MLVERICDGSGYGGVCEVTMETGSLWLVSVGHVACVHAVPRTYTLAEPSLQQSTQQELRFILILQCLIKLNI